MLYFRSNSDRHPRRALIRPRRRAMTLLEMLIAVSLFSVIGVTVFVVFIGGLRSAGGILCHNLVAGYGRAPLEHLKNRVRMASSLAVKESGNRLEITNPNGSVSIYEVETRPADDDGTTESVLLFRETAEAEGEPLLRFLSPLPETEPVFAASGLNTVTVRLWLGAPGAAAPAIGVVRRHHSVQIVTTICSRNSLI